MRTARALTIGTEFVTVALLDDVQDIMHRWARDHSADLQERLAGTGFDIDEIQMPDYRRMVFEDDDEVVQAAIDSGHAHRVTARKDGTLHEYSGMRTRPTRSRSTRRGSRNATPFGAAVACRTSV